MSPSVQESLERLRRQRAEDERRRRAEELAQEKLREQEDARRQAEVRASIAAAEEKARTSLRKSRNAFNESNVLNLLRQAEREVSGVRKHDLLISPSGTEAKLIWGNRYTIKEGYYVDSERGFLNLSGVVDCSIIEVSASEDGSISINYHTISQSEWKRNPNAISDAIAENILSPNRKSYPETSPSERSSFSDSSTTYTGETCNS